MTTAAPRPPRCALKAEFRLVRTCGYTTPWQYVWATARSGSGRPVWALADGQGVRPLALSAADALALAPAFEFVGVKFERIEPQIGADRQQGDQVPAGLDIGVVQILARQEFDNAELLAAVSGKDLAGFWSLHEVSPWVADWLSRLHASRRDDAYFSPAVTGDTTGDNPAGN